MIRVVNQYIINGQHIEELSRQYCSGHEQIVNLRTEMDELHARYDKLEEERRNIPKLPP